MKNSNYMLELFPLIVKGLEEKIRKPEKCWIKSSFSREGISFKKLHKLSDKDKKIFVYNIVLIHGVLGRSMLDNIEYKRTGSRAYLYVKIEIPFKSDEQKEKYIKFRNGLVGINDKSQLKESFCA